MSDFAKQSNKAILAVFIAFLLASCNESMELEPNFTCLDDQAIHERVRKIITSEEDTNDHLEVCKRPQGQIDDSMDRIPWVEVVVISRGVAYYYFEDKQAIFGPRCLSVANRNDAISYVKTQGKTKLQVMLIDYDFDRMKHCKSFTNEPRNRFSIINVFFAEEKAGNGVRLNLPQFNGHF
jgi:hypothetical protein